MLAQTLYDIRPYSLLSGTDLQGLFNEILGDPSPSGRKEIGNNFFRFLAQRQSENLFSLLTKKVWAHISRRTSGASWSLSATGSYVDLPVEFFMDENNFVVPFHIWQLIDVNCQISDKWSFSNGRVWTEDEDGRTHLLFSMSFP